MKISNNKKIVLFTTSLAITLLGLSGLSGYKTAAQSPPVDLSSIGKCGNSSTQFSVLLKQIPSDAQLYIKLNNTQETGSNVSVYLQTFSDSQCHLVGTVSSVVGSWSKVGSYSLNTSAGGAFVVAGAGLESLPYQAAASLLILPSPTTCTPTTNCQVNYKGYEGILSPQIISGATDQVAVYSVNNLSGVGYSNVSYYSDNHFLYESKDLKPLNRNYLSGGTHSINIVVTLKNQQTLTIYQTINMGYDYTGSLYIKSLIYRTHNKDLIFLMPIVIIVTAIISLSIARLIYKHRTYRIGHGLQKLPKKADPIDHSDIPENIYKIKKY